MDQDTLDNLKQEFAKEKEICMGANASEYHHKRFAEIAKKLGVGLREKIAELGDEIIKDTKEEPTTTVAQTTQSTASEEPTVVSTDESPKKK